MTEPYDRALANVDLVPRCSGSADASPCPCAKQCPL